MGNTETIKTGDVQVMSAGTGVKHSEFNPNAEQRTKLLQIYIQTNKMWILVTNKTLNPEDRKNNCNKYFPNPEDDGAWIHQDAWFHLGKLITGLQ
jgi:hypothetical protein